jgi:peptidyl-prolyl cis-trans isomerase SurA
MTIQTSWRKSLSVLTIAVSLAGVTLLAGFAEAASQLKAVVNTVPITSTDIAKRVNLLKLQRTSGNLQKIALDQLIDDVLKRQEVLRARVSVSTDDVNSAYARFAGSNKLSTAQLDGILKQAGVGVDHFKGFIAVSMSWPRAVNARFGGASKNSTQDVMAALQAKGVKPKTTEYILQQMIFVVPANKKGITGKRKAEAEASRAKYPGCDGAKVFAATMKDVSVRNLGRLLAPELPSDWKPLIEKTKPGGTTATRVTEKGVEYLAICKQRISTNPARKKTRMPKPISTSCAPKRKS